MNIQELKERVIGCFSPYKDHWYLKSLDKVFADYEQSNKSEESQIKENKQVLTNDFLLKLIEGMKKEIEALKKQVEAIDKFKVIDSDLKQKQERFIFQSYGGSGKFHIYDNKQEYFHDGLFSKNQAYETCRILNSMEQKQ